MPVNNEADNAAALHNRNYGGMSKSTYYRRRSAGQSQQLSANIATVCGSSVTSAPTCVMQKPRKVYSCGVCGQRVAGTGHGRYKDKRYCPITAGVAKDEWLLLQRNALRPNISNRASVSNIMVQPVMDVRYTTDVIKQPTCNLLLISRNHLPTLSLSTHFS